MLNFKNLSLRRGTKVLFSGVNLQIYQGEKIAITGKNGAGKSSLFQLIKGEVHEDSGEFSRPNDNSWRITEVAQDLPATDQSATDYVICGDSKLIAIREKIVEAEKNEDGMAIANLHQELIDAGEYEIRARAQSIIYGLGFTINELEKPVNSFSGGWQMRLQLARSLIAPADLLLLDEPTNHLDLPAMLWLEAYIAKYLGTVLIISHDREFLDATVKSTLHLDGETITRYSGNYSAFEIIRAQKLELQLSQFSKQQAQIDHFQKFINRFRAQANKAKQAQSRIKALERMEKIAPVITEADFTFEFAKPEKIPNPLITIKAVDFGYLVDEENNKTLPIKILENINQSIVKEQRIGILGANGQGKSTFIKTLAGHLTPLSGEIIQGKGLTIGYFAQHELDLLNSEANPLEHYIELARNSEKNYREGELRSHLGNFNFSGDIVYQKVGTMSGGEKSRLVLSMIVWQKPNLLLLDEPTNHLDINTREALSLAISEFAGTIILVSHDRSLLNSVCEEFWLIGDSKVEKFVGDLDDYRQYLFTVKKNQKAEENKKTSKAQPIKKVTENNNQNNKKLNQELKQLEKQIASLELKISQIENIPISEINKDNRATHFAKIKQYRDEHLALEEKWLLLAEKI